MHWSILVYVRGYSHDANFNFCFTWQEWSLSFFLLIDSKRFQRGDLNKNENQIEVTLPGPPAPGATGLFHHIFVFILLLYSIVWKTHRRRSHVCAIFQACCAIFFASGHNFYFFCILLWKFTYKLDVSHPLNLGVVKHAFQWYFTLFWGKFRIIVSMLFLCVIFLSAIFFTLFLTMLRNITTFHWSWKLITFGVLKLNSGVDPISRE